MKNLRLLYFAEDEIDGLSYKEALGRFEGGLYLGDLKPTHSLSYLGKMIANQIHGAIVLRTIELNTKTTMSQFTPEDANVIAYTFLTEARLEPMPIVLEIMLNNLYKIDYADELRISREQETYLLSNILGDLNTFMYYRVQAVITQALHEKYDTDEKVIEIYPTIVHGLDY